MQNDDQQNYWQPEQPNGDLPMYQPESVQDTINPAPQIESPQASTDDPMLRWTADERINHHRGFLWYFFFALISLSFVAIDIFVLRSYTFSVLVAIMAISLIVYTASTPRNVNYTLSEEHGLYIGEKLYSFAEFKAFGVIKDHDRFSIMLIPNKRFSPMVSIYFPEEVGEQLVDILGARLPMKELKLDFIDSIVHKLHL